MGAITSVLALVPLLVSPLAAPAQSGGSYELSWSKIAGGGGTSTNGQFTVSGTVGQADATTPLTGGQFSVTGGLWSFLSVLQTAGAPVLKITFVGNGQAVLSWPVSVVGFTLQETMSLTAPSWSTTAVAVVDTATEHTVTVPAAGPLKVFRLKQ